MTAHRNKTTNTLCSRDCPNVLLKRPIQCATMTASYFIGAYLRSANLVDAMTDNIIPLFQANASMFACLDHASELYQKH